MASTNKTENLGLPKWESKAETFTMEDMTGAFEAIDRAVSGKLEFGLVKEYTIPVSGTKVTSVDISDLNFEDYYMVLFFFPSLFDSSMTANGSGHTGLVRTGSTILLFPMKNPSIFSYGFSSSLRGVDYAELGYNYESIKKLTFTIPSNYTANFTEEGKMQVWGMK